MIKWEYLSLYYPVCDKGTIELDGEMVNYSSWLEFLDAVGNHGWELTTAMWGRYTFKRQQEK